MDLREITARNAKGANASENVKGLHRTIKQSYLYWGIGNYDCGARAEASLDKCWGFSLSIEHPEIIQGVLYLAAFENALSALLFFQKAINPFCKRVALRGFLWGYSAERNQKLPQCGPLGGPGKGENCAPRYVVIAAAPAILLIVLIVPFKLRALRSALVASYRRAFKLEAFGCS